MLPNIDFLGFNNFNRKCFKKVFNVITYCDQWSISFIQKSFYQILLAWLKIYRGQLIDNFDVLDVIYLLIFRNFQEFWHQTKFWPDQDEHILQNIHLHLFQRFVSSTVNMEVLLSHQQLIVDQVHFKAEINHFLTFKLLNFFHP